MERKVVVVCSVVGLLGLLSAAFGLTAEAMRIADSEARSYTHCAYIPTPAPQLLGLASLLALVISQIVLNVSAGCICCTKSPRFPDSNWGVALISFILCWFTFVIAFFFWLTGVFFGYFFCKPRAFGVGAILGLASSAFGIVYYLTLTAAGKNGIGNNPGVEAEGGIAMGKPQIPEISRDPVFVHEDTYIRRQFT